MARKKKSWQDIEDQEWRIRRYYGADSSRSKLAQQIADRYIDNIVDTKRYQNAEREVLSQLGYVDDEVFRRNNAKLHDIKFSRRAYMGLSAG